MRWPCPRNVCIRPPLIKLIFRNEETNIHLGNFLSRHMWLGVKTGNGFIVFFVFKRHHKHTYFILTFCSLHFFAECKIVTAYLNYYFRTQ